MRGTQAFAVLAGGAMLAITACEPPEEMAEPETMDAGPDKEVLVEGGALPYSPVVRSGDLLFLSGMIGVDADAEDQGAAAETRRVLEDIESTLDEVGASMGDAVKCTVFLVDMDDYNAMNETYAEFFPEDAPARSTVAVAELPAGAEVEIECIVATG